MERRVLIAGLMTPALLASALFASGCHPSGCPASTDSREVEVWESWMQSKTLLSLDATDDIAIKRDVHYFVVDVDARTFASAFHAVMIDPDRRFGMISVNRYRANVGEPFQLHERFQGRYSIPDALQSRWLDRRAKADRSLARLLCKLENEHTSDFGQITELELDPEDGTPPRFTYAYLDGSPIAGSSRVVVEDCPPDGSSHEICPAGGSRVRQIFIYQEKNGRFARFFSKAGLRLHNEVVYSQVAQSVEVAGGEILDTDLPPEYRAPSVTPAAHSSCECAATD